MTLRSTEESWGGVSRALHWGMFLAFIGIIAVGYIMADLPLGATKMKIYALHKSFGVLLLGLAVIRILWRVTERRPAPEPMPLWQSRIAVVMVIALYVLMIAMPLTGWLYNSAAGFPLRWFNLVNLPALMPADPAAKAGWKEWHETGAAILIGLIALHALGALKHHFIDRDRTLLRMLPRSFGKR